MRCSGAIVALFAVMTLFANPVSGEDGVDAAVEQVKIFRVGEPDVIHVLEADVQMRDAVMNARKTVDEFIDALQNPKPSQWHFAVKAPVEENGQFEHLWLTALRYDGERFSGRVDNKPVKVRRVELGDVVTIAPDDITDWMYLEKGEVVGGYTMRVLFSRASEEEQKRFKQKTGLDPERGAKKSGSESKKSGKSDSGE